MTLNTNIFIKYASSPCLSFYVSCFFIHTYFYINTMKNVLFMHFIVYSENYFGLSVTMLLFTLLVFPFRPPTSTFLLIYLRMPALTQHCYKAAGLATPGFLKNMLVQDGNQLGERILLIFKDSDRTVLKVGKEKNTYIVLQVHTYGST